MQLIRFPHASPHATDEVAYATPYHPIYIHTRMHNLLRMTYAPASSE
jgi:hypothetical protein